ncbi:MAG TPA: FUSC family protein, partial [Trebonia sp.]
LGFFIQDYVSLSDFGWLTAEVLIGTAGMIVVHFAVFRPRPEAAVRRMQRSYGARARALASEVAELYEATVHSEDSEENQREERRLQRRLLRLNEAALLIDAQLSPAAMPAGWSAGALHQRLFDAEVALSNVARFATELARRRLPASASALVVAALRGIRDADLPAVFDTAAAISELIDDYDPGMTSDDRILLHRFAASATDLGAALHAFRLYPASQPLDDVANEEFQPQVSTFAGWLPGSVTIAGLASQERGGCGLVERIRLAPYTRIAIQTGIAAGGAIIAGDAMSERRFYWALIAAFITFMGANTAGEQLRKGVFRVAGTVVGVIAGAVLAHLVGDRVWLQIVVVLVSLFLGLYLFRINYAFMAIGITVMVSQLYVEFDEFSNNLLLLRLGETAVGAGVAILTVLLVLPLHVGRVAQVAARKQLEALADLADRCLDRLADPASAAGSDLELRAAARRADVAYQAFVATVRPMRTPLLGSQASRVTGFTATAAAARHYARNLLLDASTRYADADLDAQATATLAAARSQLADSIGAVTGALAAACGEGSQPARPYVRSASLFARVAAELPGGPLTSRPHLALRDLQLLDGALAEAARWASVQVTDLDTGPH